MGFISHPRAARWEAREVLGALGEMLLDAQEEERVLPEVNEERCSGCGSCREACPHGAIEMEIRERPIALFGPQTVAAAHRPREEGHLRGLRPLCVHLPLGRDHLSAVKRRRPKACIAESNLRSGAQ